MFDIVGSNCQNDTHITLAKEISGASRTTFGFAGVFPDVPATLHRTRIWRQ